MMTFEDTTEVIDNRWATNPTWSKREALQSCDYKETQVILLAWLDSEVLSGGLVKWVDGYADFLEDTVSALMKVSEASENGNGCVALQVASKLQSATPQLYDILTDDDGDLGYDEADAISVPFDDWYFCIDKELEYEIEVWLNSF
jgi:hypothetical protein